jgi:cytochrome P450
MLRESFMLLGSFNIGDYIPYLDWMDLQGLNRRMKKIQKTQDYFLQKVIDERVAQNDPNVPRDLLDALLATSADTEFQLSRDRYVAWWLGHGASNHRVGNV